MNRKWEKVGIIGVDAGLVWIGDPCYVFHKENEPPKELGKNWSEFCDILFEKEKRQTNQFNYDLGHPGLGVCVPTGYGDGEYPVLVQRNKEGRVMKVMVDFSVHDDGDENG